MSHPIDFKQQLNGIPKDKNLHKQLVQQNAKLNKFSIAKSIINLKAFCYKQDARI